MPHEDEEALKKAVAHQPVATAIQANERQFQLYVGGVLTEECGTALDHGVLIAGCAPAVLSICLVASVRVLTPLRISPCLSRALGLCTGASADGLMPCAHVECGRRLFPSDLVSVRSRSMLAALRAQEA